MWLVWGDYEVKSHPTITYFELAMSTMWNINQLPNPGTEIGQRYLYLMSTPIAVLILRFSLDLQA